MLKFLFWPRFFCQETLWSVLGPVIRTGQGYFAERDWAVVVLGLVIFGVHFEVSGYGYSHMTMELVLYVCFSFMELSDVVKRGVCDVNYVCCTEYLISNNTSVAPAK